MVVHYSYNKKQVYKKVLCNLISAKLAKKQVYNIIIHIIHYEYNIKY